MALYILVEQYKNNPQYVFYISNAYVNICNSVVVSISLFAFWEEMTLL